MKQGYWLVLGKNVSASPADGAVNCLWQSTNSSATQSRKGIPISGTITKVRFSTRVGSTLGDNTLSTVIINKNGSSAGTISTVVDCSAEHFTVTITTAIAVTAGDYINIQRTCPTRPTTNPTSVLLVGTVWVSI